LARADRLRVLGDLGHRHLGARLDQPADRHAQVAAQLAQALERLDDHRGVRCVEGRRLERGEQRRAERQAQPREPGRVLELQVDADDAAQLGGQASAESEDVVERRDGVVAVVRGGAQLRKPLDGAQVRSCASFRSSTNQPSPGAGGEVGAGRDVGRPESSASWRATSTPSAVQTRSGSMKSAPIRTASS
jgi:hypothetical protein